MNDNWNWGAVLFIVLLAIVFVYLLSLAVTESISQISCLENGFDGAKVTIDYRAYCTKTESATSVIVPVKDLEVHDE